MKIQINPLPPVPLATVTVNMTVDEWQAIQRYAEYYAATIPAKPTSPATSATAASRLANLIPKTFISNYDNLFTSKEE